MHRSQDLNRRTPQTPLELNNFKLPHLLQHSTNNAPESYNMTASQSSRKRVTTYDSFMLRDSSFNPKISDKPIESIRNRKQRTSTKAIRNNTNSKSKEGASQLSNYPQQDSPVRDSPVQDSRVKDSQGFGNQRGGHVNL